MKKRKIRKVCFFFFAFFSLLYFSPVQLFADYIEEKKIDTFLEETREGIKENEEVKYLGILEIPSIRLKQEFYPISSPLNSVSKNIQVIKGSGMPDRDYSCLILASHSGNSAISYFKKLHLLEIGDIAYVIYNGESYAYKLERQYEEVKDGTITIHRESFSSHLILITCDRENKNKQIVYVFRLLEKK